MTASNFKTSLDKVLVHEGGFSNNPKDPGGATMKGVTQAVYDGFRAKNGLPKQSVKAISDAELQTIYKKQYWDAVKADELPPGVDYVVFDGAVNSGPSRSVKWLQQALGVTVDGVIGPATLRAAATSTPGPLIDSICNRRLAFLQGLSTWPTFGKGWASRVAGVRRDGNALAAATPVPQPVPTPPLDHVPVQAVSKGFAAELLEFILSIFKRKSA
jgi:lysozyme family protein